MEYLDFWQLEYAPFEAAPDPAFFFGSAHHSEALARLMYLCQDPGMHIGMLTGEIGAGKSTTLNVLRSRLPGSQYRIVYTATSIYSFEELLEDALTQLAVELPGGVEQTRYRLMRSFEQYLAGELGPRAQRLIMIYDEAQLLDSACLDQLKCLTNVTLNGECPLTLIFVGQPELREHLRKLPQLYQRIAITYHLPFLSREDIYPYLQHRLRHAGARRLDIFDPACIEPLFSFTRGCPREINKICKLAVDRACLMRLDYVDERSINIIVNDLRKHFG